MEDQVIERIKRIIALKSKSPRQFSVLIGFNYTTLNNYLSGKRETVSLDLIAKIISTYEDISSKWLLLGEGDMITKSQDPKKENIIKAEYKGKYEVVNTSIGKAEIGYEKQMDNSQLIKETETLKDSVRNLKKELEYLIKLVDEKERLIKILIERK